MLSIAITSAFLLAMAGCVDPGWSFPTGYDSFTAPQGYDTGSCTRFLNAAAVCMRSEKSDKAANLASIRDMTALIMAEHSDTDVIVFPELCTSWLWDPADPVSYYASVAEPVPGPSTAYVSGLASQYGVAIVFGLAEVENGAYYSCQAMLKPDGTLVKYRKRGLNSGDRANGCTPGAARAESEVKGVTVGFLICSDYQDEAVIRDLSTGGAPVILASIATETRLNNGVDFLARSLSRWVVYSNGGGTQGDVSLPGHVFVADPTGTVHDPESGPGAYSWFRIGVY